MTPGLASVAFEERSEGKIDRRRRDGTRLRIRTWLVVVVDGVVVAEYASGARAMAAALGFAEGWNAAVLAAAVRPPL